MKYPLVRFGRASVSCADGSCRGLSGADVAEMRFGIVVVLRCCLTGN